MLEFKCDCGRQLKVSNDLAGWQTQCPGCQRLIPVPSPNDEVEAAPEPKATAALPWKAIAIGASSVAVIALLILAVSAGGSKKPDEEAEYALSRVKKQLAERDREVEALTADLEKAGAAAKGGDSSKLTERARAAESERDRLKVQLDSVNRQMEELRQRMAKAPESPVAGPSTPQAPPAAPPAAAPQEPEGPLGPEEILAKYSGAVVLVISDRDTGGGFFIHPDGLVVTSYRAVAQSGSRSVVYISGKGAERARVEKPAEVVAVDIKNDLALVKIAVPQLVPVAPLEERSAVGVGNELMALGNPSSLPGSAPGLHTLVRGRVLELWSPRDGKPFYETSIVFTSFNAGVPVFNVMGNAIGVSTLRTNSSETPGCVVPAAHVRALVDGRETAFAVRGTLREWESQQAGRPSTIKGVVKEHPTGIGVGGVITRLHLDEERDRIVGLDDELGAVVVMSISKRKVLRTIPTGQNPADMQWTVNPDVVWVSHPESRSIVKVDVADGRIYDRVDPAVRFYRVVATRNHLWTFGGSTHLITLGDKSVVSNPVKFGGMVYDRRRDQIVGIVTNWDGMRLVDFSPDKMGPMMKKIADITAGGTSHDDYKELPSLTKSLEKEFRIWTIPPRYDDWSPSGHAFNLMTDGQSRVYLNRFALKRDKMESVLATFPVPPIPESASTPMMDALRRFPRLDVFQAMSPDGRWVSSGRHIFDAQNGTVHLALPVPTPDSKFSGDSKTLWIYDLGAQAVVPIPVEPK
jgi:S1-C subfamily serine protease